MFAQLELLKIECQRTVTRDASITILCLILLNASVKEKFCGCLLWLHSKYEAQTEAQGIGKLALASTVDTIEHVVIVVDRYHTNFD